MGKAAKPRRLSASEAAAVGRNLRISPIKLNLVARMIRGRPAGAALSELSFVRKRAAGKVRKVLASAVANAENNHNLDIDRLVVTRAEVGKTLVMKRWRARARGRSAPILKPFSQLRIVLREQEAAKPEKA